METSNKNHPAVYLTGKGIYLRSLCEQDFTDTMPSWINDRDVTRFLARGTFPANTSALKAEFEQLQTNEHEIQLALVEKSSDKYIGIVGLHTVNWIARHGEFRILIGEKELWGKGYGTEACQLMVAYAFEALNFNRVWLGVNAANQRAVKSYQAGGFKTEGELRHEVYRNGVYYNVVRMSILRNESMKRSEARGS